MMRHWQAIAYSVILTSLVAHIISVDSHAFMVEPTDVVFMTADNPNYQTHLYRFDLGLETIAVDTGGTGVFKGVATLGGVVLVADSNSDTIRRYSHFGSYLGPFAILDDPVFLEVDSYKNVYATTDAGLAVRLNSSGKITKSFIHENMNALRGIDADAAGNVYVADIRVDGVGTLFKFSSDGTFVTSISLGAIRPYDMAIDEVGGLLYLIDTHSVTDSVRVFDITGEIPDLVGGFTVEHSGLRGIHFAVETGNILVTGTGVGDAEKGVEVSPPDTYGYLYLPRDSTKSWDITTFVPIPEPASAALTVMAVIGIVVCGRCRRS